MKNGLNKVWNKLKEYALPIGVGIVFSYIFKDIAMGIIFGVVFYIANDKKDCCK